MTDKVKIKAIIKQYADKGERLLEEAYENGEHASTTGYWDGYGDCANLLLRELDDMQEEPVSEIDFEQELYKYFGQVKDFTLGMRIAKRFYEIGRNHQEPASEDLEKEMQHYFCKEWFGAPVEAARHFASWQKEQMMAKAVDVTIAIPYPNGYGGYTQLVDSQEALPFGENIKVLVIKED